MENGLHSQDWDDSPDYKSYLENMNQTNRCDGDMGHPAKLSENAVGKKGEF